MTRDDLVREGYVGASKGISDDDLRDAITHPEFGERKKALMRVLAASWERGWDECYQDILAILARYDMAHLVGDLAKRVH